MNLKRHLSNTLIATLLAAALLAALQPGRSALAQATTIRVNPTSLVIFPGQVGYFTFTIQSLEARTFSLSTSNTGGVTIAFPSGAQVLIPTPGGTAVFAVSVLVPSGATAGSTFTQTLTANSTTPTTLSLSVFFTVVVGGPLPTSTPTSTVTTGPTSTPGPVCRDGFEPDDTQAQARLIAVNIPQGHALCPSQDEDWLVFRGVTGKRYQIDVPTVSNGIDPTLELLDAAGKRLAFNDDRSDDPPDLRPLIGPFTITADGDYYIRVRDVAGVGGVNYLYTVVLVGLGGGSGPPPVITDLPATKSLYENQQVSLDFSVTPGSGGSAPLEVSVSSSDITLFPPGSLTLSGSGTSRTLHIAPAQTNVLAAGGRNHSGSATLTITVREAAGASALQAGPTAPGTTPTATATRTPTAQRASAQADAGGTLESIVSQNLQVTVNPPPWLAMLYLAGDDTAPGQAAFGGLDGPMHDVLTNLKDMPYNPAVRLVVLFDGHQSGDSAVYVREPDHLVNITDALINRDLVPGLPAWSGDGFPSSRELDMGNTNTLHAFVSWARAAYPTNYTFLSVVNHGGGWAPAYNDLPGQPAGRGGAQSGSEDYLRGMAIDMGSGGTALSTRDTRRALEQTGPPANPSQRIDVLFFDACLMGMIESAYEVRNVADYYVAGENLLFAWFPYHRYLSGSLLTFSTDPRKLAINLVERYNEGVVSERNPFSIAAIHLRQLVDSDIAVKLNNLGTKLKDLGSTLAGNVYANTLKFDSNANYTIDADETYVDLGDFLLQLEALDPTSIPTAAGSIQQDAAAISALLLNGDKPIVVRQRQVSGVYQQDGIRATYEFTRATGLSIYMPLGAPDKRNEIVEDPANPTRPKIKTVNQLDYYTNTTLPVCADATGCNHLSFTISGAAKGWADWLSGSSALTGQSLSHKAPNPLPANTQLYRIFLPEIGR